MVSRPLDYSGGGTICNAKRTNSCSPLDQDDTIATARNVGANSTTSSHEDVEHYRHHRHVKHNRPHQLPPPSLKEIQLFPPVCRVRPEPQGIVAAKFDGRTYPEATVKTAIKTETPAKSQAAYRFGPNVPKQSRINNTTAPSSCRGAPVALDGLRCVTSPSWETSTVPRRKNCAVESRSALETTTAQ